MSRPVLLASAAVVLAAGCWLAREALGRWREERGALAYELVAEMRPVVLRLGGALLCGLGATSLAVAALLTGDQPAGGTRRPSAESPAVLPTPEKPPPSPSAAAAPRFTGVGHPAEGELLEAAVPGADGSPRAVRVWLPPHYADEPSARYPVLVLPGATPGRTADAELPDVFDGLASAIKLGRARPFVAVAPAAPIGTAQPCDPMADEDRIRTAVAGAFRTLPPGPQGWAALGVAAGAPCAVAAELTHPELYGAAAGVSGRYDAAALSPAAGAPSGPAPRVLLAAAKDDADGLAAAHRLTDALRTDRGRAPRTQVRISDAVLDYTPERERLRLVRLAAQYLSDTLAHPAP
ncbi:hypothetical protein P3T35_000294 [Kitasatospora sp. GP30]|uniref:hypothetical protein n=1 Tax=Kitasatospora sp. GP30 TaxID=3035084 RepID=UPI000CB28B83|nr:hypothetical protein [Kitasatospora sp. GP30]MDH6138317.1 hypothetical protein [Kitasatospora sp. GP30]